MQTLVTGASGFVGRNLVRALLRDGQGPVVAMTRAPERVAALQRLGADIRVADLADPNTLAEAARGCRVVFHCAGEASHQAAPQALPWLHVAALENLLGAAEHAGVARLVLLSCADATLRNRDRLNWREQQATLGEPLDTWCRTKLTGEEVALQRSGPRLAVTAIRPAYLWGPDDDVNLPNLCRQALSGGIRLFGPGDNLFSSAHIDNVVHALRLAAEAPAAPGQAFHVSDQVYQTASEFFGALSEALGTRRPRRGVFAFAYAAARARHRLGLGGPAPAEVVRRGRACLLDIQRAINDLGYTPQTSVPDGMAGLAAWVRDQGGPATIASRKRPAASRAVAEHFARAAET